MIKSVFTFLAFFIFCTTSYSQSSLRLVATNTLNGLEFSNVAEDIQFQKTVYTLEAGLSYLLKFEKPGLILEAILMTDVFSGELEYSIDTQDRRDGVIFSEGKDVYTGKNYSSSLGLSASKNIFNRFRLGLGVNSSYDRKTLESRALGTVYYVTFRPLGSLVGSTIQLDEPAMFEETIETNDEQLVVRPFIFGEYSFKRISINARYLFANKGGFSIEKTNSFGLSLIFKIL